MISESKIIQGDCLEKLKELPDKSVDCCITSPPYFGLRDYGMTEQIGLEKTPEEYIKKLVYVFGEVKRVLKDDGTLLVNIGDSYWGSGSRGFDFTGKFKPEVSKMQGSDKKYNLSNVPKTVGNRDGYKNKDMIGIPWMLAFALRNDGWYLRQDIIWHKPNPMPESIRDRCTKSHEYIFLLSKSPKYFFDYEAIQEEAKPETNARYVYDVGEVQEHYTGKRNKRDVWTVTVKPTHEAHFATFPEELIKPCILAGSRAGGVILDPFFGSGTTGRVATELNRIYVGIELNPDYVRIAERRTNNVQLSLGFI